MTRSINWLREEFRDRLFVRHIAQDLLWCPGDRTDDKDPRGRLDVRHDSGIHLAAEFDQFPWQLADP